MGKKKKKAVSRHAREPAGKWGFSLTLDSRSQNLKGCCRAGNSPRPSDYEPETPGRGCSPGEKVGSGPDGAMPLVHHPVRSKRGSSKSSPHQDGRDVASPLFGGTENERNHEGRQLNL